MVALPLNSINWRGIAGDRLLCYATDPSAKDPFSCRLEHGIGCRLMWRPPALMTGRVREIRLPQRNDALAASLQTESCRVPASPTRAPMDDSVPRQFRALALSHGPPTPTPSGAIIALTKSAEKARS